MVNRVHTYLCITMKDTAAIVSPTYPVCPTELWPTFEINNSTNRPGISPQSFFSEPCEYWQLFKTVKLALIGHMKIFLACTTFFGQFSKNPPALSIPPALFSKSISIPPAHFFKCNNFLIATSKMTRSWLSPSNLSLGSPINSCRNQPKLPGDVLRMCDQILWKFGAGVIFFWEPEEEGCEKPSFSAANWRNTNTAVTTSHQ